MRDASIIGEKQWESPEKMTLSPSCESTNGEYLVDGALKSMSAPAPAPAPESSFSHSQQYSDAPASEQEQDPWLGVRIRASAPPDPELLSKIGCCCIVIDLPGVLMDDLSISYRQGLIRLEGERTIGRVKSFRKKISLNHDQVVTRLLTAFLWQGVLLIVAPTKLATAMAAATIVAAQIASKGYPFPSKYKTKQPLLMLMPDPEGVVVVAHEAGEEVQEPEEEDEEETEPVKFSNNVQVTAAATTAAPQPQSAFGPYLHATKPPPVTVHIEDDEALPLLPPFPSPTTPSSTTGHNYKRNRPPILTMRPRHLFFPFLPSPKPPIDESPQMAYATVPNDHQPTTTAGKTRKYFFTTGLPRNKLQKFPSDETSKRFPSDERNGAKPPATTQPLQEILTNPNNNQVKSIAEPQERKDGKPDFVKEEEEKKSESETEEGGEEDCQLSGIWTDDSLYDEPSDKPRRRSLEDYDVLFADRTTPMLSPIKEHHVHTFHARDSPAWSLSSLVDDVDRPLTYVRFETVWQDNDEENLILRNHNRGIDMDMTNEDVVDRQRLSGMHGNPNGPLEQRGILLPFEDELYDKDDRSLRMELEPHPCWRSAPFLPNRREYMDDDARGLNMAYREQHKPPSPSLLRRNRLSGRKTVTWVDEI
jgi:HSP20 family molecular chaperone IbpA